MTTCTQVATRLRVSYLAEDDILFVLREGVPSETCNLTVDGQRTLRIAIDSSEAVGFVITEASTTHKDAIEAWLKGDKDLVERYFEQDLEEINGRFQARLSDLKRQVYLEEAKTVSGRRFARRLATA